MPNTEQIAVTISRTFRNIYIKFHLNLNAEMDNV